MKLADYLREADITISEFARRIDAKNARTVQRYTKHGRVPSGAMMAKIMAATEGRVQPTDFFSAPTEQPALQDA